MTVRELIEKLKKWDGDDIVIVRKINDETELTEEYNIDRISTWYDYSNSGGSAPAIIIENI